MSNWKETSYGDSLYTATLSLGELEAEFPHGSASVDSRHRARRTGKRTSLRADYGRRKLVTSRRISLPGTPISR
jgi:hypothetical protein